MRFLLGTKKKWTPELFNDSMSDMEKFASDRHSELQKGLPFSYFSTRPYLDFAAYTFERNGESLLVWQDTLYPNEFPCIFMPKKKENWVRCSTAFATQEDITNIKKGNIEILMSKPMGAEFFYATDEFVEPKGDLKNRVNKFRSSYVYSLASESNKAKIIEFYNFWKSQKEHESITFEESEEFFQFCLDNLNKYDIKQAYVEIDGRMAGLAWGIACENSDQWVGLHLKVDYQYKGLSRFLHHERARMFADRKEFSLGTGAHDKGIDKFKEELGPAYKKEYHYLLTGEKK